MAGAQLRQRLVPALGAERGAQRGLEAAAEQDLVAVERRGAIRVALLLGAAETEPPALAAGVDRLGSGPLERVARGPRALAGLAERDDDGPAAPRRVLGAYPGFTG